MGIAMQKTSCLKIESYTHPEVDWGKGGGGLQGPPPPNDPFQSQYVLRHGESDALVYMLRCL